MLPEVIEKEDVLVQILRRMELDAAPDDDEVRDSLEMRQTMTLLIPDLGDLIRKHARRMGERVGADCPFQTDQVAEWLLWLTVEYLTMSEFDSESRIGNVKATQLTMRHSAYYFDTEV
jgi:hypothetical protein